LLRGIYSAESALSRPSTEERIIEFYLRTKFDSSVLQEFAKQVLTPTFDSLLRCDGEFDSSIDVENLLKEDLSTQLSYITQVADNYRALVIDICTRLLDICGLPVAEDMTFPVLCSPNLKMMMSCFRSYLSMHQAIEKVELSEAERQTENFVDNLKRQKALAEQELVSVQSELKALKVRPSPLSPTDSPSLSLFQTRYDSLFSESGGRNQTVVRQQTIIDTLEVQVRSFHKQLEDIQMERKRFAQTESVLRGELLTVTTQYNSLRALYESEICTLRPLFQEQVALVSEDRKEMSSLRTDVELSAKRFCQSEEKLTLFQQEVNGLRREKAVLERRVEALEQKVLESAQETKRQKRLVEITLAAKLSSDSLVKEADKKRAEMEKRCQEVSALTGSKEKDMERSLVEQDELRREVEELREQISRLGEDRSGDRAEREAQEMALDDVKAELAAIKLAGFTEEKRQEWEDKVRLEKEISDQLRKHKNQLKMALTRVHEMQEEIDSLRLRLGPTDLPTAQS
jgi:chromosome segregation ATPase